MSRNIAGKRALRMRRKSNRHGFQNFGGRHTGEMGLVTPANVLQIKWIANIFPTGKALSVPVFDAWFTPVGDVIRHDLRHKGLINEEAVMGQDFKRVTLTAKAKGILKSSANIVKEE